jgi:putative phage-type endonuclease
MLSDSDYVPSHSDSDSTNSSIIEEEIVSELCFTESELADITEDIMLFADEMIKNNIISLSSPKFYDIIIQDIVELMLNEWQDNGIINYQQDDEDDIVDELQELVEQIVDVFISTMGPRRSIKYATTMQIKNDNGIIHQEQINKITALQKLPQPKQKTREWYEFRYGLISASNLWKVFGTDAQQNSLISEKCVPFESFQNRSQYMNTESAMHWGNKYEPVTVMVYEAMFGTKVGEFGCIRHPAYPYIGASPDGINIDTSNSSLYGRMLEIKNIVNREITGIPKEEYWIQTQIQMETCDLDECDFMETRFKEYSDEDVFYEDEEHEYKGIILHFIERNLTRESMPIYKYMPADLMLMRDETSKNNINEWIKCERILAKENDLVLFTKIYWYLEEYSCVLIERNRDWFRATVPKISKLWEQIEERRKDELKKDVNNSSNFTVVKLS